MEKPMSLILILLLLFGLVMPTFAQEGGQPVNCNGLSESDCQILIDSSQATSLITSFTIPTMQGEFNMSVGPETLEGKVSGSVAMVLPGSLMAMMSDMQGMQSMTDMQPMIDFYSKLTGEMLMQMLSELGLHVTLDELVLHVPGETPLDMNLEVIFKDMSLYLRLPSPSGNNQWFGDTLELGEAELAEFDTAIEDMVTQLQSEDMQAMMAQMSELEGWSADINALVTSYVTTTRGEDVDMMGQSMAVFTTTFDLKGLLADPELPALIMRLLENPALAEMDLDMEEMQINETQIQFVLMTVGLLLKEVSISSTQYIGLDDKFIHRAEFDLALDVDLSLMGDPEVPGLIGSAHFEADLADINSTTLDGVEVPADFLSLDKTGGFLVGGPGMIEGELKIGETFSGSFDDSDNQDIFSLSLAAGQTVQIEIASEDFPYVNVYGPDGLLLEELDTYYEKSIEVKAGAEGIYLVEIEGYWDLNYDLTVRAG